jgi:hypothetical protein
LIGRAPTASHLEVGGILRTVGYPRRTGRPSNRADAKMIRITTSVLVNSLEGHAEFGVGSRERGEGGVEGMLKVGSESVQ